jgi:hypothetical protein
MNKRPIPVTIIACVLIAMGAIGIAYHFSEYKSTPPAEYLGVLIVRLLAIVSGVFLLRGKNWARWLAMAWIAFHVVLSYFHSLQQVAFHAVVMAVIGLALFYPAANRYFRSRMRHSEP